MKQYAIGIAVLLAAGVACGQTFTDVDVDQTYGGKTGWDAARPVLDANFAMIESGTADLSTDDINASGADTDSLGINLDASTNAQMGTIEIVSETAVAGLADNDYVRIELLESYDSATNATVYSSLDAIIADLTSATEDGLVKVNFLSGGAAKYVSIGSAAAGTQAVLPGADDEIDLGASGAEFKDLYVDGTASIDALSIPEGALADSVVVSADIKDDTVAAADIGVIAQSDTNDTTAVATYTPDFIGQVLVGSEGAGTNALWIARGTTTNDWFQLQP